MFDSFENIHMNDELSDDIKKKFMLPRTIELKEKCFMVP